MIDRIVNSNLSLGGSRKLHLHAEALGIDEKVGSGMNASHNLPQLDGVGLHTASPILNANSPAMKIFGQKCGGRVVVNVGNKWNRSVLKCSSL